MKFSKTIFFTLLTAGFAATTSIVPATAAQFAISGPAAVEKAGNQDVILAAVRNNQSSRPAQRSASRPTFSSKPKPTLSQSRQSRPNTVGNSVSKKPRSTQTTSNNSSNTLTLARNSGNNSVKKNTVTATNGGNKKPKNTVAQGANSTNNTKNRITQTTQQTGNKGKTTTASNARPNFVQPSGLTKTNPMKTPNQLTKTSAKPPGSFKPAIYQSKLTSTFKSKHKQMPSLGKGRQMPPNWKHNPNMLAGLKGFKNNYKPYWFKSGGQTWFRYYYTYAVAGVAYWYWCNLTPSEVEEQRVVLTSYTSGDCNCDTPPPAPPECDCDDDDCSAEE